MDPLKSALYSTTRSAGLKADDPLLLEEIQLFIDDVSTKQHWLILKIENSALKFFSKGNSCGDLLEKIDDSDVFIGYIKCVINSCCKCYFFYFVGGETPAMKKGKAFMFKGAASSMIECHGEIKSTSSKEEFSIEYIEQSVRKMSNDHSWMIT